MAAQLAQLLGESDRDELDEIVRRWLEAAPTPAERAAMEKMGDQILALRTALDQSPQRPSRDELELTLRMMLRLAVQHGG